jgi:hypothetical protein
LLGSVTGCHVAPELFGVIASHRARFTAGEAFGFGEVVGECLERFRPEVMRVRRLVMYGAADATLYPRSVAELILNVF